MVDAVYPLSFTHSESQFAAVGNNTAHLLLSTKQFSSNSFCFQTIS